MNRIAPCRADTSRALAAPPVASRCFSLRVAAWLIMLLAVAPYARAQPLPAVDWATAHDPATARIALTREQMAQARINVPAGTRAYAIGGAQAPRQLLAWYRASDGKLLAALEVVTAERPVAHEGVRVHAGAGTQGRASALLEVGTPRDDAALLAAHDLTLRGADAGVATAVPLLAYRGSAHLVALAPSAEQKLLRAPKFDVQARNAAGTVQTELRALSLTGGAVPIAVTGATTKPRVPVEVFVMNPGSEPRYVQAELKPPLQWQQRAGEVPPANPMAVNVIAAPQTRTPLGSVLSDAPGAFNLSYRDVPVNPVESGNLSSGPLVGDPTGSTGLVLRSQDPLSEARINYDAGSNVVPTQPRPPAPAATLTEQSGRSGNHLQRVVLIGALAGTATLALRDRAGRDHQGEVTIVPNEERDLQRQAQWVTIAAVESGAPVWLASAAAPARPCNCDKLSAKPKIVLGDPDVMVAASTGGQNESVLTVLIDANWLVSIVCRSGDGNCKGTLEMSVKSSGWRIGKKESTPLPKSEDVYDADPAKLKNKLQDKTYTCLGDCNMESPRETPDQPLTTRYVIQIAHGKLQGKAPNHFGGSGKIGEAEVTGTVVLTLKSKDCPGPEAILTLNLKGKAGKLAVEWPKPKK